MGGQFVAYYGQWIACAPLTGQRCTGDPGQRCTGDSPAIVCYELSPSTDASIRETNARVSKKSRHSNPTYMSIGMLRAKSEPQNICIRILRTRSEP